MQNINTKRVFVAAIFGFITGVMCYLLSMYALKDEPTITMIFYILANRTLIGFVIGISKIQINWALHGLLIGFIVGIPFSVGCLLEPDNFNIFIASLILSAIYGLIVELFTSVVFKAKS